MVGLTGDGGFNMVLGELETARRMKLGITVVDEMVGMYERAKHCYSPDGVCRPASRA